MFFPRRAFAFVRRIACISGLVLAGMLAACSSAPRAPSAPPGALLPLASAPARLTPQKAADVTLHALSLVGTRYRRGGNTPDTGFDCSGLIAYVYKHSADVLAPRTVAQLSGWGAAVPSQDLRSGDLVVFTLGGVPAHAGIYVGDGRFVHAPSTGGDVRLDSLGSGYWQRQAVAYRRP